MLHWIKSKFAIIYYNSMKGVTFYHDFEVMFILEVVGIDERLVIRISGFEQESTFRTGTQDDRDRLPTVGVWNWLIISFPHGLFEAVVVAQGSPAVWYCRTGDELQLQVRIIVVGVIVFRVHPRQTLRPFSSISVSNNFNSSFLH